MNYKEYKEALKEKVEEQLENVEVRYTEVVKNNDTKKEALVLETKGDPVVPLVYLDDIYPQYERTQDLEESKNQVILLYRSKNKVSSEWILYSWEQVRSFVRIRLVCREGNAEYLENRPYKEMMDMAVVFVVALQEGEEEISLPISWQYMDVWGIGVEELYQAAMENLGKEQFSLLDLSCFLSPDLTKEFEDGPAFYALTTPNRVQGARAILRKDLLQALADQKECNLFILPSSVHEILLVEEGGNLTAEGLAEMVSEINRNSNLIQAEEVLTDSVYYYDREKEEVRIAA